VCVCVCVCVCVHVYVIHLHTYVHGCQILRIVRSWSVGHTVRERYNTDAKSCGIHASQSLYIYVDTKIDR
jgi:hypothetical protein